MDKRYNVGFETIFGKKVGTVAAAENMDAAIKQARVRFTLPLKPGSASQACDDGPGDENFARMYEMRYGGTRMSEVPAA
ncbi:hypothetical protein [Paraburkholderia sp. GAS32]|uniref:hypothetical protein n=1 Tax=Paraburkholderia sp. GAS32 TaxID=3035129 RepID=UPI003D236F33